MLTGATARRVEDDVFHTGVLGRGDLGEVAVHRLDDLVGARVPQHFLQQFHPLLIPLHGEDFSTFTDSGGDLRGLHSRRCASV